MKKWVPSNWWGLAKKLENLAHILIIYIHPLLLCHRSSQILNFLEICIYIYISSHMKNMKYIIWLWLWRWMIFNFYQIVDWRKKLSFNSIKQLIYSEYYFQIIRYFPGINLIYMFYYEIQCCIYNIYTLQIYSSINKCIFLIIADKSVQVCALIFVIF